MGLCLPPPPHGQNRPGSYGTSPGACPVSQETLPASPQPLQLQPSSCGPGLLSKPACLLPSSWQAACWEPVAIETRPRRMLQDSGKRDALARVQSPTSPMSPPPPRERKKTHISVASHMPFTLVSALGTVHVHYWPRATSYQIPLLSFRTAKGKEVPGTREHT
jgi:hypothetical protein